jgi:hypothetical protein
MTLARIENGKLKIENGARRTRVVVPAGFFNFQFSIFNSAAPRGEV